MVMTRLRLLVLLLLVTLFSPGCLNATGVGKLMKMNALSRQLAKVKNQEILFFGKVVDLDGEPVSGAEVEMSVRVYGAITTTGAFKELHAVTDQAGLFSLSSFGELISLSNISREGYVYHYKYNPERFRWSQKPGLRKGAGFEEHQPMVFRLRKKAPPSFLKGNYMGVGLVVGKLFQFDLYRSESTVSSRVSSYQMTYKSWHPDLQVSLEADGDDFKVVLEMLDADSGLQVAKKADFYEQLTEAPEHGYQSRLEFPLARGSAKRQYLYVKNEGGLFYSKLFIRYKNRKGEDKVSFGCDGSANLTGGRGLEYGSELAMQYRADLASRRALPVDREQLRAGTVYRPVLEAAQ